jgi:hypothetical protein
MELRLVDFDPPPDGDRKPDANRQAVASPTPGNDDTLPGSDLPVADIMLGDEAAKIPDDPFLAEARREHEAGQVDQPLWAHASARHQGDEALAMEAYLRARATALKLERRQRRGGESRRKARGNASGTGTSPLVSDHEEASYVPALPPRPSRTWRTYAVVGVPAVLLAATVGWWLMPSGAGDTASAARAGSAAVSATPAAKPAPRADKAVAIDPGVELAGKVEALKAAGNWNVLVLYAAEWTRKQPGNATAWKELSLGYSNLRQYNDALEAGAKAAQLAPEDPRVWRTLGQVNLEIKEPAAALSAFERAAALDASDGSTLLAIGTLSAQLDRLPQARAAFDRVLEGNPDNLEALCGSASVAQRQGRAKDADAIGRLVQSSNRKCREVASGVAVAVPPKK